RSMKRWVPGVVVVGVLLSVVLWIFLPLRREPKFDGKRLSYWFKEYCRSRSGSFDRVEYEKATAALKQIGTNAVPYLLEEAFSTHQDSAIKSDFYRFINEAPRSWGLPLLIDSEAVRQDAPFALMEIKPPAAQLLFLMREHLKSANLQERRDTLYILGTAGDGA